MKIQVNRKLLPVKAHFFFFFAALGPILPQLNVYGRQLGVSAEVMGYVTAGLPLLWAAAKPTFGYIVDYWPNRRKLVFMLLIVLMTGSYCGLWFIPTPKTSPEWALELQYVKRVYQMNDTVYIEKYDTSDTELLEKLTCYWSCLPEKNFEAYLKNDSYISIIYLNVTNFNCSDLFMEFNESLDGELSCKAREDCNLLCYEDEDLINEAKKRKRGIDFNIDNNVINKDDQSNNTGVKKKATDASTVIDTNITEISKAKENETSLNTVIDSNETEKYKAPDNVTGNFDSIIDSNATERNTEPENETGNLKTVIDSNATEKNTAPVNATSNLNIAIDAAEGNKAAKNKTGKSNTVIPIDAKKEKKSPENNTSNLNTVIDSNATEKSKAPENETNNLNTVIDSNVTEKNKAPVNATSNLNIVIDLNVTKINSNDTEKNTAPENGTSNLDSIIDAEKGSKASENGTESMDDIEVYMDGIMKSVHISKKELGSRKEIQMQKFEVFHNISQKVESGSFYVTAAFWGFVVLMCVGTVAFNVANCIGDAVCFDVLGPDNGSKYGSQRAWGTAGYGVTALLGGWLVDLVSAGSSVKDFTPAFVLALAATAADLFSCRKLKLPPLSSPEDSGKALRAVLKIPRVVVFICFAVVAGLFDSFIIYYMFWFLEDLAEKTGHQNKIKLIEGLVVAGQSFIGEIIFFAVSGRIINRWGYGVTLTASLFCYGIRMALISFIYNPWHLIVIESVMQGPTYALCYSTIVGYAAQVAPAGYSATVQGIVAGMDDGVGFALGSLVGGQLYVYAGGRESFRILAAVAAAAALLHALLFALVTRSDVTPPQSEPSPPEEGEKMLPIHTQHDKAIYRDTTVPLTGAGDG